MNKPCDLDHNGECLVCDCWISDCAYDRYLSGDYRFESKEELEKMFQMKVKIERSSITLEETTAEFPIYSMVEEEDFSYYVKLEEDTFSQIKIGLLSVEVMKWKSNNKVIPEIWWNNRCSEEEWEDQLQHTKAFISSI